MEENLIGITVSDLSIIVFLSAVTLPPQSQHLELSHKEYLTIKDIALLFTHSERNARRFVKDTKLPAYAPTLGTHKIYRRKDVQKEILKRRVN